MRVLNLGIHVATATRLELHGASPDAVIRITSAGSGRAATLPTAAAGPIATVLPPGEYVITADSETQPRSGSPLGLTTDGDVTFVSAAADGDSRALVAWTASSAAVGDPKDPWPRPPPPPPPGGPRLPTATAPSTRAFLDLLGALADATPAAGKGAAGPAPVLRALLVGIDAYDAGSGTDGTIYRSLSGAVRDVLAVEQFLLTDARVPPERIAKLLSPRDPDGSPRPTYAAIVGAWRRLIDEANPGDVVYLHFSCHGGRAATLFPGIKGSRYDEAIAPCDINDRAAGRYLRDVEIAHLLAEMAAKGLITALVLDACHSGSLTRGDEAQARRGDLPDDAPRADALATSLVAPAAELEALCRELEQRPRGADVPWLVDTAGAEVAPVTVIAACRAHQAAYEYAVDGVHAHGALTYSWLEALRQRHAGMTYADVHREVHGRVHGIFSQQSPVLLGAGDRLVLGAATLARSPAIPVTAIDGDRITLGAGTSSLIDVGTRVVVIPREILPELVEPAHLAQLEVTQAGATESIATLVQAASGDGAIAPGGQALVVAYAPRLQRSVRLLPSTEAPAAAEQLAAALAADTSRLVAAVAPVRARSLEPEPPADFQVAIDRSARTGALIYAILEPDGTPVPNLEPELRVDDPRAPERVRTRLVHLARYANVRALANTDPGSTLAYKLGVTLHADRAGAIAEPLAAHPVLAPEAHFWIRIANRSLRPLSISVLDLGIPWDVVQLGDSWELDPGATRALRLVTSLPDGWVRGTGMLKVIASRDVICVDWLTMQTLDEVERAIPPPAPKKPTTNAFEELLHALQDPPTGTRSARLATVPTRDWTEARALYDVARG